MTYSGLITILSLSKYSLRGFQSSLLTTNASDVAINSLQGKTLDANRYATKKTVAQGKRSELKRMGILLLDENITISDHREEVTHLPNDLCK